MRATDTLLMFALFGVMVVFFAYLFLVALIDFVKKVWAGLHGQPMPLSCLFGFHSLNPVSTKVDACSKCGVHYSAWV